MNKITPTARTERTIRSTAWGSVESFPSQRESQPAKSSSTFSALYGPWSLLVNALTPYKSAFERFRHMLGLPYIAMTLFLSARFLIVSQSTLQNDLFWSEFNSTSGGIYIANMFNTMLMGRPHGKIKLTDPEYAIFGTMTSVKPQITFSTAYINILLFHRLNTPEQAIASLRRQESNYRLWYKQTQFCWVDFDRRFSLAHTAKRAERCLVNDKTNGAVYLESYMRNFDAVHFLAAGKTCYSNGIKNPLSESADGRDFLDMIDAVWNNSVVFTVEGEVEYWRSKGITHFTMQWGNLDLPGVTEHIEYVGALGVTTNFTIKSITSGPGLATTIKMYWTPVNDFWAVDEGTTIISGMSLVRGTSKFYENFNISMEQVMIDDGDFPYPFTPTDQILRNVLGPFGSIDMKHQLYPNSLFDLVMNTTAIINEKLLGSFEAQQQFSQIPERIGYALFPAAWRDPDEHVWGFVGGNPLCSAGTNVAYIQAPLSNIDSCSTGAVQEVLRESRMKLVLSLLAVGNPALGKLVAICSTGVLHTDDCVQTATLASQFISSNVLEQERNYIRSLAERAHQDLLQVNPEVIQFVVNNTNASQYDLLHQPVLTSSLDDSWNFFGWWLAVDWVTGSREVIRFEGDEGSLTLLSARVPSSNLEIRGTEITKSVSVYFLRIMQYTTIVSILCAFLVVFYTVKSRGQVAGANLLEFNRVTAAVWIGRPLVLARGIVAVCMISTSKVFLNLHYQMTKFDETQKAWYNVIITASESCWFSYVTVDLIVPITQGYTYVYAVASSILVQVINAGIEFVVPFEHNAEIDLQCEMVVFHQEVSCRSGRVEIGTPWRFITISSVAVMITLLTFVLFRLCMRPCPAILGGEMLLSGIAKEVFVSDGWVHEGRWYLDKASALLSGLVAFDLAGSSRVLEVKTWTPLYLQKNCLYSVQPTNRPIKDKHATSIAHAVSGSKNSSMLPAKLKDAIALVVHTGGSKDFKVVSSPKSGTSGLLCGRSNLR